MFKIKIISLCIILLVTTVLIREVETGPQGNFSKEYEFDKAGNRASMLSNENGETSRTTYSYDRNNRLLRDETTELTTANQQINSYVYDANGNQTMKMSYEITVVSAGDTPSYGIYVFGLDLEPKSDAKAFIEIYTYDVFNRLTKAELSGIRAEYTYRADGLRTSKTVNGETTKHIWDGMNLIADITTNNTTIYSRGINLIFSNANCYYLYNAHGDVVQLVDNVGNITKEYRYDAFGVERNKDENDQNPFRYTAEYYDKETGTIYLRMRYYIPHLGRFLTEDPIKDGLNWYTYVNGNPVNFVDSSGLVPILLDYIRDKYNNEFGGGFSLSITSHLRNGKVYKQTINITIGKETNAYDYQSVGGLLVIDSDWLVRDFGISRFQAEHQVGDLFVTMNDAALAWSMKYWAIGNELKTEYASIIYKGKDGGYFFDEPNIGTDKMVRSPELKRGYEAVAGIHSHPRRFNSQENFSGGRMIMYPNDVRTVIYINDKGVAQSTGLPQYLATPNGNLKIMIYEQHTGNFPVSTIYSYNKNWVTK